MPKLRKFAVALQLDNDAIGMCKLVALVVAANSSEHAEQVAKEKHAQDPGYTVTQVVSVEVPRG